MRRLIGMALVAALFLTDETQPLRRVTQRPQRRPVVRSTFADYMRQREMARTPLHAKAPVFYILTSLNQ